MTIRCYRHLPPKKMNFVGYVITRRGYSVKKFLCPKCGRHQIWGSDRFTGRPVCLHA